MRISMDGSRSAEFDLTNAFSITTEVDNYYRSLRGKNAAQQNFVIGPQLTFRSDKATLQPFVYVQGGDQRSATVPTWAMPSTFSSAGR